MQAAQGAEADPEATVLLEAIREATRYVCRAVANLADVPSTRKAQMAEENLARALDVLQAELEETAG